MHSMHRKIGRMVPVVPLPLSLLPVAGSRRACVSTRHCSAHAKRDSGADTSATAPFHALKMSLRSPLSLRLQPMSAPDISGR
eukprot:808508-Rhodomonas_salina.4